MGLREDELHTLSLSMQVFVSGREFCAEHFSDSQIDPLNSIRAKVLGGRIFLHLTCAVFAFATFDFSQKLLELMAFDMTSKDSS